MEEHEQGFILIEHGYIENKTISEMRRYARRVVFVDRDQNHGMWYKLSTLVFDNNGSRVGVILCFYDSMRGCVEDK